MCPFTGAGHRRLIASSSCDARLIVDAPAAAMLMNSHDAS